MATYATTKTGADIRPSLSALAKRLEVGRSTLTKYVAEGVRLGWLECTEDNSRHGKRNVYRLTRPTGGDRIARQGVTAPVAGGDRISRQGVTAGFRTTGVATGTYTGTEEPPAKVRLTPDQEGQEQHDRNVAVQARFQAQMQALDKELDKAPPFE